MPDEDGFLEVVIIRVAGSAPTAVGDAMLLGPSGWTGTVGGGHLEWALKARGEVCLREGLSSLEEVTLNSEYDQCCGGHVTALVCSISGCFRAWLGEQVSRLYAWGPDNRPALIAARVSDRLYAVDDNIPEHFQNNEKVSRLFEGKGRRYFLKSSSRHMPLWLFGAGHVASALAPLASDLEYTVSVFDARPEWNTDRRFPAPIIRHMCESPLEFGQEPAPIALIMTHSHVLDFALAIGLLRSRVPYLGIIGSQTKAALFRHRLSAQGFSDEDLRALRMPMGIPGLGKKPQEIAVSVLAELLQVRYREAL